MKYKRKETRKKTKDRKCVDVSDYNYFNTGLAHTEALAQLQRAYGNLEKSFATPCNWSVGFEVKNARFEILRGSTTYGLSPKPRCEAGDEQGGSKFDILGRCSGGPSKIEYTPGGSKPPCPNNKEGTCVLTNSEERPVSGSSWQDNRGVPTETYRTALSYDYKFVPKSIKWKPSGKSCGTPMPEPWGTKQGGGGSVGGIRGDVKVITQSRCFDETKDYDCCCTCDPVKVPVLEYCPSPVRIPAPTQAQMDQLRTAILVALAAGLCVLALTRGAALRALMLGAAGAAGCTTSEDEIEGSCTDP